MKANYPTLPSYPAKTGPGRKRPPGPVPAWALKLGGVVTTLAVFAGSFGYASSNVFVTNAPLQPAVATITNMASTSTASATSTTPTTTLTPSVRTTTRTPVTRTASS